MSLAQLFYAKETFRERVRRWRQACFRTRLSGVKCDKSAAHVSRFVLEALEPRLLLSATPTDLVSLDLEAPAAPMSAASVASSGAGTRTIDVEEGSAAWTSQPVSAVPETRPLEIHATTNFLTTPPTTLSRLAFLQNDGQADASVAFVATGEDYGLTLSPDQWVLSLTSDSGTSAQIRMSVVGGNPDAQASGVEQLPGVTNFTYGNNPSEWITGVPSFERVRFEQVYDGISVEYYGNAGEFEYDWFVAPGADPNTIALEFSGMVGLGLNGEGDLVVQSTAGDFTQHAPIAYQLIDGNRVAVEARYEITGDNRVGFDIGEYDRAHTLIIDPVLSYSTYLGSQNNDRAHGVVSDNDGNMYVLGEIPLRTSGGAILDASLAGTPFQVPDRTLEVAFVTKFDPAGKILSSTLLGEPVPQFAQSRISILPGNIAIGPDGQPYASYVVHEMSTADDSSSPEWFKSTSTLHVVKLSADGTPVFDTVVPMPMPHYAIFPNAMAVGSDNAVYVSYSPAALSSRLPSGDIVLEGELVPLLTKLDVNGNHIFTEQLAVTPRDLAVDATGSIYLLSGVNRADLPVSANALQANLTSPGGPSNIHFDTYLMKLDESGQLFLGGTYFGGSSSEFAGGLALDANRPGIVYFTGVTRSEDLAVSANGFQRLKTASGPLYIYDGFVAAIDFDAMKLMGSTYLGGNGDDSLSDVALDQFGAVYVVGETNSTNFPLVGALQGSLKKGPVDSFFGPLAFFDMAIAKLDPTLSRLEFSTYLGSSGQDSTRGITSMSQELTTWPGPRVSVGPNGTIHVASTSSGAFLDNSGATISTADFPTANAAQTQFAGGNNALFPFSQQHLATDVVVVAITPANALAGKAIQITETKSFTNIVATFTVPSTNSSPATFTATISWGDGTTSEGAVVSRDPAIGQYSVVGTHRYERAGAYAVSVQVTDGAGKFTPIKNLNLAHRTLNQYGGQIAIDPTNPKRLAAVISDEGSENLAIQSNGSEGGILLVTSADGGINWTSRVLGTGKDGFPTALRQPDVVFDAAGNLFVAYVGTKGNDVVLAWSRDGGVTFAPADSQSIVAEGSAAGGVDAIRVASPKLGVSANAVWLAFREEGGISAARASVAGIGQVGSFSAPRRVSASSTAGVPDIAIGPSGDVVIAWQDSSDSGALIQGVRGSAPEGEPAFGDPKILIISRSPGFANAIPGLPKTFVALEPQLAWDTSSQAGPGRLYLTYTDLDEQANGTTSLYLLVSDDNGETWSGSAKVQNHAQTSSQFQPGIAVDPVTGILAMTWYHSLEGGVEYLAATSSDGGVTFSTGVRTSEFVSNGTLPGLNEFGQERVYSLPSTPAIYNRVLYPIWSDNNKDLIDTNTSFPQYDVVTAIIGVVDASVAPPEIRVRPIEAVVGSLFEGPVASFRVPGSASAPSNFTAQIAWGDGNRSAGVITQPEGPGTPFLISGTHTYAEAGSYPLAVGVTDLRTGRENKAVSNVSGQQGSQTQPAIAIDPSNPDRAFAAWQDVSGLLPPGISVATSNDGGVTWNRRTIADGRDGLPQGAADAHAKFDQYGNLFLTYISTGPKFQTIVLVSNNGGLSFRLLKKFDGEIVTQPSIAVGPGLNGANGSVWLTWKQGGPENQTIVVAGAQVNGLNDVGTFSEQVVAPTTADGLFRIFGDIAVGPDGQVSVTYSRGLTAGVTDGPAELVVHLDPDGLGPQPFGSAVVVSQTNIGPRTDIPPQSVKRIDAEGNLAWDRSPGPHRGRLYLVYTDNFALGNPDTDIRLRYSDDNGLTWSAPSLVDGEARSAFLPSVAVDQTTGNLAVGWYSTFENAGPASKATLYRVTLSDDGGRTYRDPYFLPSGLTDLTLPEITDRGAQFQYGGYSGIAFDRGVFQPIWTDNSSELGGVPDQTRLPEIANARIGVAQVLRAPLVLNTIDQPNDEGVEFTALLASFSDPGNPGGNGVYRARISWGDNTPETDGEVRKETDGTFSVLGTHEYRTQGRYVVTVTVTGPGVKGAALLTANIENAPQDLLVAQPLRVVREAQFTDKVIATFTDGNRRSKAEDFIATVEWGDGSASLATLTLEPGSGVNGAPNTFKIAASHKYLTENTFTIKVSVRERAGDQVLEKIGTLVSGDPPLVVNPGKFIDVEALAGINTGDLELVVFERPDDVEVPLDTTIGEYRATINWGDGNVDTNIIPFVTSEDVTVTGRHTYATAGSYFPTITLVDDSGGVYTVQLVATVQIEVTTQVQVTRSGLVYDSVSDRFEGELTVFNKSGTDIPGPFYVVIQGLTPGVTLESFTSESGTGEPIYKIDQSRLLAGQNLPAVPLVFNNPSNGPIEYTVKVFDGVRPGLPTGTPLVFEPNRGQADSSIDHVARGADYLIGLGAGRSTILLSGQAGSAAVVMEWLGGNEQPQATSLDALPGVSNYINGANSISNVPHFGRVRYASVYDGIDLEYYGRDGLLEYDWVVAPGADAGAIQMRFRGANQIVSDVSGNLRLQTNGGELIVRKPVAYQLIGGQRQEVTASFKVNSNGTVGFEVGSYDATATLVIDPVLVYSTYLGGGGVVNAEAPQAIAVDSNGNSYITGRTLSADFPTANAFDDLVNSPSTPAHLEFFDAYVTKLDANGVPVFSTFLGGATDDNAWAIDVDGAGRVYVAGSTNSLDFPTRNSKPTGYPFGYVQPRFDGFISRLSSDGVTLTYSTLLPSFDILSIAVDDGGSVYATGAFGLVQKLDTNTNAVVYIQQLNAAIGRSIAIDALGQAYVAGFTSNGLITKNALFPNFLGGPITDPALLYLNSDGFVAKLAADGGILFSTYLGGGGQDQASGIAIDSLGTIYVGGSTTSTTLPTPGGLQTTLRGGEDGFLIKLANDGSEILYGTYIGGSGSEQVLGLAVDAQGRTYLAGATDSQDLPVVRAHQPIFGGPIFSGGGGGLFADGFAASLNAAGTGFDYLTYAGGSDNDHLRAVAVDNAGNAAYLGVTASTNLPLRQPSQNRLVGFIDAFVLRLLSTDAGTIVLQNIPFTVNEGNEFNGVVASFTSNGTERADQFSAVIDWGDGTQSAGTISGDHLAGFQVSGRHFFANAGTVNLAVTVRDSLGRPVGQMMTTGNGTVDSARYRVVVDTTSLAGQTGIAVFQFNPGAIVGAPNVTARVSGLTVTGGTVGTVATSGGVSVDGQGVVTFTPTSTLNRLLQNLTLGTKLEFDLELSGPGIAAPVGGNVSEVFALQLFAADGVTPLLASDGTASILRIDVRPNGTTNAQHAGSAVTAAASVRATIANAPIDVDLLPFSIQEGLPFNGIVATFTSQNPFEQAESFQAMIDWADGSAPSAGVVAFDGTKFTVTGSHVYRRAGNYAFSVTITEPDGASVTATSSASANPIQASHAVVLGGSTPFLVNADFNRDGKLDTVAGRTGGLSVFLGNGDFSFAAPTSVTTVNQFIAAAAAADFNGDTFIDLAVAGDQPGKIEILLGNGNGAFTAGPTGPDVLGQPTTMATGDFDGDGVKDLALGYGFGFLGGSDSISTFRGNGDGTFQAPLSHVVGLGNAQVHVADLNRDNRSDIVVGTTFFTNSVSVILGGAGGSFSNVLPVTTDAPFSALSLGDVNGDGNIDIALGGNDLALLTGKGDGTFNGASHHSLPVIPQTVMVGDLNGDGRADVVAGELLPGGSANSTGRIAVLTSTAGGFSVAAQQLGTSPRVLGMADWNGDGKLDVAAITGNSNDSLSMYPGRGDGTLQAATPQLGGDLQRMVTSLDVNGDGFFDLVTAGQNGVVVSLGDGTGIFGNPAQHSVSGNAWNVAIADVNGDGRADLIGSGAFGVAVLLRMEDGSLAAPVKYAMANVTVDVAVGDLNNDGRPDIVASVPAANAVAVLLNQGGGRFVSAGSVAMGTGPRSLMLRDFDADGRLDLAATVAGTFNAASGLFVNAGVSVARGNGDGSFAAPTIFPAGSTSASLTAEALAAGDVNGDGKVDLVVAATGRIVSATDHRQGGLFVLLGNGDATFAAGPVYLDSPTFGGTLNSVTLADFNNDTRLDIAVSQNFGVNTSRTDDVLIVLGNGDGSFNIAGAIAVDAADAPGVVLAGDLDADGKIDLIVAEQQLQSVVSGLNVLRGNGDGTFAPRRLYFAGDSLGVALGDVNGDGALDVATADFQGELLGLVLGNGDGTLAAPLLSRTPVKQAFGLVPTDINGDGRLDFAANYVNEIGMLIGNGDGTFQFRTPVAIPPPPNSFFTAGSVDDLTVTDLNGDGQREILLGLSSGGVVMTVPTSPDGTMGAPVFHTFLGVNGDFAFGDFTSDGRPDAVRVLRAFSPTQPTVSVLRSQTNFTFVEGPAYPVGPAAPSGNSTYDIVVADFNTDGRLDLAIATDTSILGFPATETGNVTVLLGNGDGTFQSPALYDVKVPVGPMAAGDLDRDGDIDLVGVLGANAAGTGFLILKNQGNGDFGPPSVFDSNSPAIGSIYDLAIGDLAGDGLPEIIFQSLGERFLRIASNIPTSGARVANGVLAVVGTTLNPVAGVAFTAVVAALTDTNPLATATEYSASINWGDGSTSAGVVSSNGQGGFHVTGSHTYAGAGLNTITVTVNDDEGGRASGTSSADVSSVNAGITAAGLTFNANAGTPFSGIVATFLDADVNGSANDFSATINWGDGQSSIGTIAPRVGGGFNVSSTHTYANSGTFAAVVTINDIGGTSTVANSTAQVAPHINIAPITVADSYATNEDQPLIVAAPHGVLANDSDLEGTALNVVLVSGPTHGTLVLNSNGSFSYTPAANFSGSDTFTYKANDGQLDGNVVSVTLTIHGVNDAPAVQNDSSATDEDAAVTINVLANDSDVDGTINPATVVLTTFPLHGTATVNPVTGAITYRPAADFVGVDSIGYKVRDNLGALSKEAMATITVRNVNDAPVARPDGYVLNEDTQLVIGGTIGLLANDSDIDSGALNVSLVNGPVHGTLAINANGSFAYTPAADFSGSDRFTYKVSDGNLESAPVTVWFTVQPVNDGPVIAPITVTTIDEGGAIALVGSFADPDIDDSWTASVNYGDGTGVQPLTLTGKTFSLNHAYAETGLYAVTVNVTDQKGQVGTRSFNVTVRNVAPVVQEGSGRTVNEGTPISLLVSFTDAGVRDSHSATIDWGDGSAPQPMSVLEQNGSGTVRATHVYADEGLYQARMTVTDDEGAANSVTVPVTVTNAAPQVDAGPDRSIESGGRVALASSYTTEIVDPNLGALTLARVSGSFFDLGTLDTHTATIDWGDGTIETRTATSLPINGFGQFGGRSGIVNGTHIYGTTGTFTVRISVTDNDGGTSSDNFVLTIGDEANQPPTVNDQSFSLAEHSANGTVVGTIVAMDPNVGQALSYALSGTAFAVNLTTGQITVANSALLDFETTPSFVLTATVTDNGTPNLNDTAVITINLSDVNDAPVLEAIGNKSIDELATGSFTVAASDVDTGQSLSYSLDAAALALGATINVTTGAFSWTPSEVQGPGVYTLTITVADTGTPSLTDSETIQITVNEVNQDPILGGIGDRLVNEGETLTFTINGTDADLPGNTLTFSASNLPSGATFDPGTRTFSWTPTEAQGPGVFTGIVFSVSDGRGGTDSETIQIMVDEVNQAPVAVADAASVAEGGAVTVLTGGAPSVLANDTDAEGDALSAILVTGPTNGTLTFNANGTFNYMHNGSETLSDSFTYKANDGQADSNTVTVSLTITPVNDAPVVNDQTFSIAENSANGTVVGTIISTDLDAGQTRSYAMTGGSGQTAFLVNASTGQITVANSTLLDFELTSSVTLNVTVTDNGTPQLSDTAVITITLSDVNEAPELGAIGNRTIDELATVSFTATASDVDAGQSVSYSLDAAALALGATINATTGQFSWTPSEAQGPGVYNLTITVADTGTLSLTDSETIQITVNEVNQNPVLGAIGNRTVNEGATLTFTLDATDTDLPGNTLTFGASNLPTGATFDAATRTFSWTSSEAQGPNTFTGIVFTVSDGQGGTDSETISITVNEVNQAPELGAIGNRTVQVGQTLTFTVTATDADLAANGLTLSSSTLPTGATFDGNTGVFSWTPTAGQTGEASLTFAVTDNGTPQLSDSETITLTVRAEQGNRIPDAVDDAVTTKKNQPVAFNVLANDRDPDGDTLTITAVTKPQQGTIEIQGACLVYTPDCNFTGVDSVVYTISDGRGGTDTATLTITVKDRNHKPDVKHDEYRVDEDQVLRVSAPGVLANDRDRDGDQLAAKLVTGPKHGTLVLNQDGSFVYMPEANFHGKDSFTYRASDGERTSEVAKVTILVASVNDAPVLASIADQTIEEGRLLKFKASATDIDGPKEKLTFSLGDGAPAGATINAKTGEFKWTPSAQQGPGVYEITVQVSDGEVTDSQVFKVTVTDRVIKETLIIRGTTGCDVIKVYEADGGVLNVSVNGEQTTYKLACGAKIAVYGLDGNDVIILKGLNRDATVYGGNGNDLINACQVTNGKVRLFGENGCDVLIGGCGDDVLDGGNGKDLLIGGGGKDQLKGENGKDWLFGGKGDDALFGGNGRDLLIGGDGDDCLNGGRGKDITIQDRSYKDTLKTALSNRDWVKEFLTCCRT